jgi:glycosyltransferase involved in cell wall biosynthesis
VHRISDVPPADLDVLEALCLARARWMITYYRTWGLSPSFLDANLRFKLLFFWQGAARVTFVSDYDRALAGVAVGLPNVRHVTVWSGAAGATPGADGELPEKGTEFVWLWPGPCEAAKRPDVLLQAVRQAADAGPARGLVVWLAGGGPLEGQVRQQVRRLGLEDTVRVLAPPRDVAALCARADGLLLTGDAEGLPVSLVEAMALQKPVVATAGGGVRELIRHQREGLLCASGDVAALAAAIRQVVERPEQAAAYARAARDVARQVLTHEEAVLRYALLYLEALSR